MQKPFELNDKVTHYETKAVGTVKGLRAEGNRTIKVVWDKEDSEKGWYSPEELNFFGDQYDRDLLADEVAEIVSTGDYQEAHNDVLRLIHQQRAEAFKQGYESAQ